MSEALDSLVGLIKEFEGCELQAYRCPSGVPTIGWGFTQGVQMGDTCTQEEADERLYEEAQAYLDAALRISPKLRSATPGQQAAIADFVYNCGEGNYRSSTLKRNVDAGDFNEAKHSIKLWNKGGGKVLKGLVRRRQAEANLL